jgi:3-hydroxy acid dehydrogenase/malonic semialdehyde reductase
MPPLSHRTALVTGAASGIGAAIVARLSADGATVLAVDRDEAGLKALADTVPGIEQVVCDLSDPAAVDGLPADVDVLVNNAGIIGDLRPVHESTISTADALIDINLRAAVHSTMAVLPGMVRRNLGHIVFTGSIAATRPTANGAVYSATKAALQAFADGLRMDIHGAAVRVTVLAPGRVETNLYDQALGGHEAAVARLYSGAQAVQPSDIATLVGMALAMPAHVDVTRLEVVPTMQVFGGSAIAESG